MKKVGRIKKGEKITGCRITMWVNRKGKKKIITKRENKFESVPKPLSTTQKNGGGFRKVYNPAFTTRGRKNISNRGNVKVDITHSICRGTGPVGKEGEIERGAGRDITQC